MVPIAPLRCNPAMLLAPIDIALVAATFVAAGVVKGVTGMGLPTVAMGVLGALIAPRTAAALLLVPSLATNLWQLFSGGSLTAITRRLWPMMLAIAVGTVAGSAALAHADSGPATAALGVALVVYAGWTLLACPLRVPARWERWLAPSVGAATGLVTGATGVFVMPAVPYLQSLDLERDELIQALGLSFTVSTLALAAGLGSHGALASAELGASVLAVAPALAGMWLGQALRSRIGPQAFRRGFLIVLLALGAEMALRSLR